MTTITESWEIPTDSILDQNGRYYVIGNSAGTYFEKPNNHLPGTQYHVTNGGTRLYTAGIDPYSKPGSYPTYIDKTTIIACDTPYEAGLVLQIQCDKGVKVFWTISHEAAVEADIERVEHGETNYDALWTEAILAGTSSLHTNLNNVTGLRFEGKGKVNVKRV